MSRPLVLALLLSSFVVSPAHAVRDPDRGRELTSEWPRRTVLHADRQIALERRSGWQGFRARYGAWRAVWNEHAETPDLATGPGIALGSRLDDRDAVDRALRGFVDGNPAVFRAASRDLETVRVQHAGRVWYASYRRRIDGVPVLFERWEFRVGGPGRLMAFGVDAEPLPVDARATPVLDAAAARAAARAALRLPQAARVEGGDRLYWLPDVATAPTTYHLVRDVRAFSPTPPASWIALVDAADGTVRWSHDRLRYDIAGAVTGTVHTDLPTDQPQPKPFVHQRVQVGNNIVYSDDGGIYDSPAAGTVSVYSEIEGLYCEATRADDFDATFSATVTDPGLAHISWLDTNSHPAERDGYYHVNRIHDHVHVVDPGFVGNDYSMPCVVNYPDVCNAFWDGYGLNFFQAGQGCPNTATMPDVVYHEYGHGVNDNLYIQAGATFGLSNGALHEGLADVTAAFFQDNPIIGKGFFGPSTSLRSVDNTRRWPEDGSSDPHASGLIVAGAMWDLRESLGLTLAEHLGHFAKYGIPDDGNDGLAMGKYFVEMLVADDNDGNLANGTPHQSQIAAAFGAHGIGTGVFIAIGHVGLEDQPSPSPYAIQCQISYSGPIGGIDPASPRIRYSVNGSPYGSVPLGSTGGNDYVGSIPAPARSIVRYYLSVNDTYGDVRTLPRDVNQPIAFLAGPTTTSLLHDFEAPSGWSPGDASDDATSGRWQWVEPQGSIVNGQQVQPEDDHTPTGILCFVTENPHGTFINPGDHDVDNGHTTLYSAAFNALAAGPDPLIEYYRWYTNNLGSAPSTDLWRVDLSNDGGNTWHAVESTALSDNSWKRVVFFVKDVVAPSSSMLLRFIAEDSGQPSLVEAAVDDFRLLRFDASLTAVGDAPSASLELSPPSPNPSAAETRLTFQLPSRSHTALAIFDLSGRRVRELVRGVLEPGPHAIAWDGRDDRGASVASGLYFARLDTPAGARSRRVVRSR
jgi:hypothetical protein